MNEMVKRLMETGEYEAWELYGLTSGELFEKWCEYEGLVGYSDRIIRMLKECGFDVTSDGDRRNMEFHMNALKRDNTMLLNNLRKKIIENGKLRHNLGVLSGVLRPLLSVIPLKGVSLNGDDIVDDSGRVLSRI